MQPRVLDEYSNAVAQWCTPPLSSHGSWKPMDEYPTALRGAMQLRRYGWCPQCQHDHQSCCILLAYPLNGGNSTYKCVYVFKKCQVREHVFSDETKELGWFARSWLTTSAGRVPRCLMELQHTYRGCFACRKCLSANSDEPMLLQRCTQLSPFNYLPLSPLGLGLADG